MGRRAERLERERTELTALVEDGGLKEAIQDEWRRRSGNRQSSFYNMLLKLPESLRRRYHDLPDGRTVKTGIYYEMSRIASNWAGTKDDLKNWWMSTPPYFLHDFGTYFSALPRSVRAVIEVRSESMLK